MNNTSIVKGASMNNSTLVNKTMNNSTIVNKTSTTSSVNVNIKYDRHPSPKVQNSGLRIVNLQNAKDLQAKQVRANPESSKGDNLSARSSTLPVEDKLLTSARELSSGRVLGDPLMNIYIVNTKVHRPEDVKNKTISSLKDEELNRVRASVPNTYHSDLQTENFPQVSEQVKKILQRCRIGVDTGYELPKSKKVHRQKKNDEATRTTTVVSETQKGSVETSANTTAYNKLMNNGIKEKFGGFREMIQHYKDMKQKNDTVVHARANLAMSDLDFKSKKESLETHEN